MINSFTFDFYFEKEQKLSIILKKNSELIKINTTAGDIIGAKKCTYTYTYSNDESLVIKAEKLEKEEEDMLSINFKMESNLGLNFFKRNKIYYLISSGNNDLYESAQNKDDGTFDSINIPTYFLQPFYTVNFYNLEKKLLFSFDSSIDEIKSNKQSPKIFKIKKDKYITVYDNSEITKNFTFIDYIKSGVKIALSIGIDFTGSNGHPEDFGSLHSIEEKNDYERAITACAKIVGYYDDDQKFPIYGFGAIINAPGFKEPSMCFNLNVIRAYHDCIKNDKLTFAGPTEFTPLIKEVISRINQNDIFEYHILMILTDGVIDDLQQTTDILVEASLLPLSVIIIGIGNADFTKMETLDGDEIPLTSSTGEKRKRDLVQFVKFSKYESNEEELSKEIFAEIPRQIVEYYQFKNLNPEKIEIFKDSSKKTINNNILFPDLYNKKKFNNDEDNKIIRGDDSNKNNSKKKILNLDLNKNQKNNNNIMNKNKITLDENFIKPSRKFNNNSNKNIFKINNSKNDKIDSFVEEPKELNNNNLNNNLISSNNSDTKLKQIRKFVDNKSYFQRGDS